MTDVPSGAGRPGDETEGDQSGNIDDDALADAILATYTSSIPVIRSAPETAGYAFPDDEDTADAEADAEEAPAPIPAPAPASTDDERLLAETASWTSYDPSDSAPERAGVWDLDDDDAEPGPSTVWDLGDAGPAAFERFDLPAPEDAEPVDLLSDATPKPWEELPAPSPAAKADDGRTWASTEEPITPFDPQPFPIDDSGPWTRLVEPEAPAEPDADADETLAWSPPKHWAPPAAEVTDLFPAPALAMPELVPDENTPAPADPEPEPAGAQPESTEPLAEPVAEPEPEAEWTDVPPAPPVGGSGGTATPWFDLASAPPPTPPLAVEPEAEPDADPEPDPVVEETLEQPIERPEPEPVIEPEPVPDAAPEQELGRNAGDADYRDDDDGSVDESDRAPIVIAGLPPGTVQTSALPPAQPAVYADTAARPLAPPAEPRTPRVGELERVGVEPTPLDRRAGRATRLFWLWFAANASVLSLGTGGVLFGMGMSLRQAIVAALGGVALSFLPLGLGALAGKWSGQPTLVVSRASFGLIGNILPAVIAVLSRAVWGGALLWVVGDAVRFAVGGSDLLAPLLGVIGGAVVAGLVAVLGYGLLSRVQLVLSIVTAVIAAAVIALTANRVDLGTALGVSDGPWILVASGVVIVFTFVGLAWVHSSADVARYQSPTGAGSANMLSASLGAGVPAFVLIGWGAVLAASSPAFSRELVASPIEALAGILPPWFPAPLVLGAVLASIAGTIVSGYSGGFALLAAGVRVSRPLATTVAVLLAAVVGSVLLLTGADARDLIRDVLTTMGVPVAAWAGIFGAEVMIRNRRFHAPSLLERGGVYPDVRVGNLVALVLITAVSFGFTTASVPWLAWQGWFFTLLHIPSADPLTGTDIGVLVALALGLLVPLLSAIPAIRRQEAVRA